MQDIALMLLINYKNSLMPAITPSTSEINELYFNALMKFTTARGVFRAMSKIQDGAFDKNS